jgi:dihydrofolate synthase/folylpolyglutamate synthase
VGAPIIFAEEEKRLICATSSRSGMEYTTKEFGKIEGGLGGNYQAKNANTLLSAVAELKRAGFAINDNAVRNGFRDVCRITGFTGRWQTICETPRTVCDAGHNIGGVKYIVEQLERESNEHTALRIVFGMVSDKDITSVLAIMPKNAEYYFTQASIKRAMPASELKEKASAYGLHGNCYPTVETALQAARNDSSDNDFIFIGGSCFIVADLLTALGQQP